LISKSGVLLMICERLDDIVRATGGRLVSGAADRMIQGVSTDTRSPVRGGLFIALRGDNFNGNAFAIEAVRGGAAALLLDDDAAAMRVPDGAATIIVKDTRAAYLAIAARHRQKLSGACWLGITGSVGKSSTKEMLAHVLEQAGLSVHKARASFNNSVGLSHTILGATEQHSAVVLELGTNHPGEIRSLTASARPDIAVITCAAESHLEAFGSVSEVAREKGQILAWQESDGVAVLNADDPNLRQWQCAARGRVLTFGCGERADVRAKHLRMRDDGCAEFMVRFGDALADCALTVPGVHQVNNALAAIAAAVAAGVWLDDAAHAMSLFSGVKRRFAVHEARGIRFIDDAYNANPASFSAALRTLKTFKARRKFVVAGDMLELGVKAADYHRELGRQLADCDLSAIVTVGPMASLAGAAAMEMRTPPCSWVSCLSSREAALALKPALREGDVVLVKGSHGIHLEECLALLSA
jgi:UDP-N-acetylmuramoyl-tripeptide--D-alanyl-D-alanine ligase